MRILLDPVDVSMISFSVFLNTIAKIADGWPKEIAKMGAEEQKHIRLTGGGAAARAALLSAFVVPGAGQIYNREWVKGIFLAFLFLAASLAVLVPITIAIILYYSNLNSGDPDQALQPLQALWEARVQLIVLSVSSVILYIYSIMDAYRKRKRMDAKNSFR
ncbi:MAG: hypothetical protein C4527_29375 [Candidatus Omnitrophota bacterium]|jgi:TM2 domain-containing membrane protein YozV|nr:MAG: hypothetical protein C4527_29375 [Candidatus Omnitrophota bacterium]